jgi:FdhD protein
LVKKGVEITRVGDAIEKVEDYVVVETPLTIYVNGLELATLLCSPHDLKYLTVGFLAGQGLIHDTGSIKEINVDEYDGVSKVTTAEDVDLEDYHRRIVTSGCLGFYSNADLKVKRLKNEFNADKEDIIRLMRELESKSELFKATGGVHSSALCDKQRMVYLSEDIGRHNTVDKIIGYMLMEKVEPGDKMLLTTGRMSSEMVLKVARAGIPLVASRSAPTDLAVTAAAIRNVTLVGFVRNNRVNVYTNRSHII